MPENFVANIRTVVRGYMESEQLIVREACEKLVRQHTDAIDQNLIRHAVIVLHPVVLEPLEDVRMRCGIHSRTHTANDADFDWPCVAAMARALSVGVDMEPGPEEEEKEQQ